jgi:hypothetical protein
MHGGAEKRGVMPSLDGVSGESFEAELPAGPVKTDQSEPAIVAAHAQRHDNAPLGDVVLA